MGSNPTLSANLDIQMKDNYYWIQKRYYTKKMGGKCVKCGSTKNLEFDHIDPRTKEYTITSLFSRSPEIIEKELAKCQLLCHDCHIEKSKTDGSTVKNSEKRREFYATHHSPTCKSVVQLDMDDNVLNIFQSVTSTLRSGYDPAGVRKCCKLKRLQYNGFKWRYETDEEKPNFDCMSENYPLVRTEDVVCEVWAGC